jgi:hypothetical protein
MTDMELQITFPGPSCGRRLIGGVRGQYHILSIGISFRGRWMISALEDAILNSSIVPLAQSMVLLAHFMVVHTRFIEKYLAMAVESIIS